MRNKLVTLLIEVYDNTEIDVTQTGDKLPLTVALCGKIEKAIIGHRVKSFKEYRRSLVENVQVTTQKVEVKNA